MGVSTYCTLLKEHRIDEINSGIKLFPESDELFTVLDKRAIDLCLNCPLPVCVPQVRDLEKLRVK